MAMPTEMAVAETTVKPESYPHPSEKPSLEAGAEDEKYENLDDDEPLNDIFKPLPLLKGVAHEPYPLTIRAVLVGIVLGSLVNSSNVYLGLKTGFTFGASMFGAIFGYGIIQMLSKALPTTPVLGMPFGPQENSIIQASATGAGGMGGLFVAALPAMYQLDLLSYDPKDDFGRILTLTLVCSFFGLFCAVPLRKFFIVNVARELRLIFPTSTATAVTIRSMHAFGTGAAQAMKKIKALGICFVAALVHRVASYYAPGILYDWHVFSWFFIWSDYTNWAQNIDNWGWIFEWTPAFIGSGMLVGLNTGISFFMGTVFAWGFVGPILVRTGECIGIEVPIEDDPRWAGQLVSFWSMSGIGEEGFVPSPRYWFLWPGVMVLVAYSMAEFFVHWKVLWYGAQYAWRNMAKDANGLLVRRGKAPSAFLERQSAGYDSAGNLAEDFAAPKDQVPGWVWSVGALAMTVVTIIICVVQFNMNAGLAILALILGIIFAFLSIHGAGVTDIAPLTASSKASQLVFGGATQGLEVNNALKINLIAGGIASGTADMATALVGDFRVGYLLQTPPKLQFYAQAVGSLVAMFLAPGIFVLFMSAYPCVVHPDEERFVGYSCPFRAPSASAWKAVAQAVTDPDVPIPWSSGGFSIAIGIFCVVQVLFKYFFLTGAREKYRNWLPNWMAIGIAWVIGPTSAYAAATFLGACISAVWSKKWASNYDTYCFAVAAGLIAGEGLGGVVGAALQLGGVSGDVYGSMVGCPYGGC